MVAAALPQFVDNTGRWAAIVLGLSIPVSVAMDNLLLVLLLAGWLAGGSYARKWAAARYNPAALCALVLFGILLAGTQWGNHPAADTRDYLFKYFDLILIPLFIYYFRDPAARKLALKTLTAALIIVLSLSYMIKFGVISESAVIRGTTTSPVVFKWRITHNLFMAFGAFLFAWMAFSAQSRSARICWALLGVFAAINVTLMVEGATGYVVLFALSCMLIWSRLPKRAALASLAGIAILAATLLTVPGPFSDRVQLLTHELQGWQPGTAAHRSSAGYRLEFYRNTLDIIVEHPLAGVGTGGFPAAYADKVRGTEMVTTRNPHNEYLHIAAQTGFIGLSALIVLFVMQWRLAARLPTPMESGLARGLVLTMVIGCLFNSFLLDHTEGLFFAWMSGLLYGGLPSSAAGQTAT